MSVYKQAGLVLDHLEKNAGSVKGSLAASGVAKDLSPAESKRVLALVIESLKYKPTIQTLLTTVPILSLEKLTFPKRTPPRVPSSANLVLVLCHDLLFSSKKRIEASNKWAPKEALSRHQTRLRAELVRLQIKLGKSRVEDLAKRHLISGENGQEEGEEVEPYRYIRYNPNVDLHRKGDWSLEALHRHLAKRGYAQIEDSRASEIPIKGYKADEHLDPWYEAGAIILQDKASCMPAKVLMEGWTGGECIDGTAAPGNKTSYISALSPKTPVTAFERDPRRFKTLEKMLDIAQCKNVARVQGDFTQSDPRDAKWAGVSHILLDPSCSGSGIVNRLDYLVENENEEVEGNEAKALRLEKLAAFQLQMIQHAFKFPNATRVVYSTCSIHAEEDERVVASALKSGIAKERGWRLAPRSQVLPTWPRRGRPEEFGGNKAQISGSSIDTLRDAHDLVMADSVIRCLPQDRTNGFFVSCFVRGEAVSEPTETLVGNPIESDVDMEVESDAEEGAVPTEEPDKTAAQKRKAKKNKRKNEKKKAAGKRKAEDDTHEAETLEVGAAKKVKKA